ncbi:HNH endonuclease [Arthrobacter sp. Bz4]|nr:HNH endonuclease [Arthrobacter sp. Bz4]
MKSSKASSTGPGFSPEFGAGLASNGGSADTSAGTSGATATAGTATGYGPGGPLSVEAIWTAPVADTVPDSTDAQSPDTQSPDAQPEDTRALAGWLGLTAVGELDGAQALDALKDVNRARSWLDAQEAKIATRLLDLTTESMGPAGRLGYARTLTESEVGAALHLPERTAGALIEHSELLTRHYRVALAALEDGRLSRRHAWAVVEEATSIPDAAPEVLAAFENRLVDMACKTTVSRFCYQARRLREQLHPESTTTRHKKAVEGRLLQLTPAYDGMAWLEAYLPVEQAAGIFHRVDTAARNLQGPDEPRTLTQLRADVFADVLTSSGPGADQAGGASYQGVQAKVFVTVPVMTLLGGDVPGELEGYGPINPDLARKLAGHAPSFTRILTHPFTGARLGADATTYRVPKDLRDSIRVRDRTCRHPGCNRLAVFCELDHTKPWANGGKTSYGNLAALCKRHHRLKSEGYWHYRQPEPGTIIAISPAGETYITRPDPPPAPPAPDPAPF